MENRNTTSNYIELEAEDASAVGKRRKKLWQISSGYHCSLIGACFSRQELKKIAAKKTFSFESEIDVFSVHRDLSACASSRSVKTRTLQKMLDLKYRSSIKRYKSLVTDEDIEHQWCEDLKAGGSIAGAYWAVMTHPMPSSKLIDRVYGDCHMISYDIFSLYRQGEQKYKSLGKQIVSLEDKLRKDRLLFKQEREHLRKELYTLQQGKAEAIRQRLRLEQLSKENSELTEALKIEQSKTEADGLYSQQRELRGQVRQLKVAVQESEKNLETANELFALSDQTIDDLQLKVLELETERLELQEEIVSLEEMFKLGMGSQKECNDCNEKISDNCQGVGLSGKAVLYVGGRKNMVSHYKKMVEKHGGIFLHHDGGKENSRNLLPSMLNGADAVLCPIDCVSHDACKCVKKICKRNCKPFVMMRSSGLSSLARGLGTIIQ